MYELVTLILVIYVVGSIMRRTAERRREVERLSQRVSQLNEIVARLQKTDNAQAISEQFIELELRDLEMQMKDCLAAEDPGAQEAFEHLHYVEETISKSIFVPREMPSHTESTI